jgi:hypothetical protein
MKKLLVLCAALVIMLTPASMRAADVTGTWTASTQSPDGGGMQLTFTFKQDGDKLAGSVDAGQGSAIDITNGKIDGDHFTFDVSFNGTTIHHDCMVDGDQIKMTTKSDSGDFPGMQMTLKRAQPAAPAPSAPPQ